MTFACSSTFLFLRDYCIVLQIHDIVLRERILQELNVARNLETISRKRKSIVVQSSGPLVEPVAVLPSTAPNIVKHRRIFGWKTFAVTLTVILYAMPPYSFS